MEKAAYIENSLRILNERLASYIPPRETWTPADEALYTPTDLLRVPLDEAQQMQFKAIKHAFTHHYTYSRFYSQYCKTRGVTPDDLKTTDDFDKIPLIPDSVFKQHPTGKDLARWITGFFTGELPPVVIKGANPTVDDIINAFNEQAGLKISISMGTSGQHTVVPRDERTFRSWVYSMEKMFLCGHDHLADHAISLQPKPSQTHWAGGTVMEIMAAAQKDQHYAMDLDIPADLLARAFRGGGQSGTASTSAEEVKQKIIGNVVDFLVRYEKTNDTINIFGAGSMLLMLLDALKREGRRFDFGERGSIRVGGGAKLSEHAMTPESFRKTITEMLGIPETNVIELYGATETNLTAITCPEGHYYHSVYTYAVPLVLDDNLEPVSDGERGRVVTLDGLATTYPGFVITGDEVRTYEHCPVCDRPGPVLDEIGRAPSVEIRSCSEVVRRTLEQDLAESK